MEDSPRSYGIVASMERLRPAPAVGGVEENLIDRARRGDRRAFDDLVRAHLPRVWRVVWKILRHREDTEDVVQEVFLAAHQALGDFRGDSRFSTWLHRIAVNQALNHRSLSGERFRREARSLDLLNGDGVLDSSSAHGQTGTGRGSTPMRDLEMKELERRLAECLKKLPPDWRAVIALRLSESLSYEEIARTVGTALGTVRSRLARARLALRRCVAEEA